MDSSNDRNDGPNPLCINEIAGTNLWIGNLQSLKEIPKVSKHRDQMWTIVSVVESDKILQFAQHAVAVLTCTTGMQHKHYTWQLADNSQCYFLCDRLVELLEILDLQADARPCLVHCAMGISRSAAVCTAWLLHTRQHPTVAAALTAIRTARPSVQPNLGLLAALRAMEQCQGDVWDAMARMSSKQKGLQQQEVMADTTKVCPDKH